ncbi:hypothetical protein T484DRAFT_1851752 [Baffinella frigidus]|nr:hypothetical protein T484DRAFT_1851752 [Cryptophyta sp. CCMP2293]
MYLFIIWTGQIKAILNAESETPLLRGENPGPDAELSFWNSKAQNLNMVRRQLVDTKISKRCAR